jgi:hypothetical protein
VTAAKVKVVLLSNEHYVPVCLLQFSPGLNLNL